MTYFPILSEAFGFGYGIGNEIARIFSGGANAALGSEVFDVPEAQPQAGVFTEAPASVATRDNILLLVGLAVVGIYFWKGGKI